MTSEQVIVALTGVIALGVCAQWVSGLIGVPSILLLVVLGVLAGPVTGLLDPDQVFGASLLPLVSISVALILYEGGLSLRISELRKVGRVVGKLLTLGVLVSWGVSAWAGYAILDLQPRLAVLLGAILVVTGPTVVGPLLRHVRPVGATGSVLKWEGIAIDPVGALLAVLVFEAAVSGDGSSAWAHSVWALAKTIVVGGGLGLAAAGLLILVLKQYWVADELRNGVSLMLAVVVFAASNTMQEESGLLASTVMGIAMANQKWVDVEHIVDFKEDLRVLLIGVLFILLGARLGPDDLAQVGWEYLVFIVVLIVVGRPASVWVSTIGSGLSGRERVFLACMAPRGIVAAAVASVFAIRLDKVGYEQANVLVPAVFSTIVGTVAFYGLAAGWLARYLGLADRDPQGAMIVGADTSACAIAQVLKERGFRVLLVDTNRELITAARMAGLRAYQGSILSEHLLNEVNLGGIGRLLAMTPNNVVNVLSGQRFSRVFGTAEVYKIALDRPTSVDGDKKQRAQERVLFGQDITRRVLTQRIAGGSVIKATNLTEEFGWEDFCKMYGQSTVLLFLIRETDELTVVTSDKKEIEPKPGQTVIALVDPVDDQAV